MSASEQAKALTSVIGEGLEMPSEQVETWLLQNNVPAEAAKLAAYSSE